VRSSTSNDTADATAASQRNNAAPTFVNHNFGFRVLLQQEVGRPALAAVPWVPLFDGKDLNAWNVAADFPGAWTLQDGILTGKIDGKAGKSRSLLLSKRKDFHNFHARVEMKVKNGRGGLMFSGQSPLFKTNLAFVNIDPRFKVAGWQIDSNGTLSTGSGPLVATLQPDTWFTLDVIAHRSEATYFINGERLPTSTTSSCSPDTLLWTSSTERRSFRYAESISRRFRPKNPVGCNSSTART
jgi:hypothetical protein